MTQFPCLSGHPVCRINYAWFDDALMEMFLKFKIYFRYIYLSIYLYIYLSIDLSVQAHFKLNYTSGYVSVLKGTVSVISSKPELKTRSA